MKLRSVAKALKRPLFWDILLILIALAIAYAVISAYYPGRANIDIIAQARQALGMEPYSDWHPPMVAYVWEAFIGLTGEVGSLLFLQVGLVSAGSVLIALHVHRTTHNRWMSLAPLSLPVLPWSLGQLGILWKDSFMAGALLTGVALLMCISSKRTWTLWFLVPAYIAFVFAIGTRKNAVFAVLPISVYASWIFMRYRTRTSTPFLSFIKQPLLRLGAGALIVLVLLGGSSLGVDKWISHAKNVESTGQLSQVLLDDVMFSVPEAELNAADAPLPLKNKINEARTKCIEMEEIWDAYWNCYGRGKNGVPFTAIEYQDELKQLWLQTVAPHPGRYLKYRLAVFSHYFFTSRLEYWDLNWDNAHGQQTAVGLGSNSRNAEYIMKPYVMDFGVGIFPMVFKPWFWFGVAATCLALSRRIHLYRAEITVLSTSALFYILGYIPIAPANHFRYTYWPALAATVAVILLLSAYRRQKKQQSHHTATTPLPTAK